MNLALDILGKDPAGYHTIRTIFHELQEPFDELMFEETSQDRVEISCDHPKVPLDEKNTVWKAATLIKKHFGIKKGVKISIKKRIPPMSGLGGGSSNAAATLKALTRLWNIPILHTQYSILNVIGMDCAFFLHGGTALGEHFGEKITPLPPLPPQLKFEIIETGIEISSHSAYKNINLSKCGKNLYKTKNLITAIRAGNAKLILANLHNDFEDAIPEDEAPFLPMLRNERAKRERHQAVYLCGSGGALFRAGLIRALEPKEND